MVVGRLLNKVINIFTGLFAIATLILMLVGYINSSVQNAIGFGFLPAAAALNIERFRNYFMLATIFCAGIEFTLKRSIVVAVVFAVIVVAVAGFMIYSDVTYVMPAAEAATAALI